MLPRLKNRGSSSTTFAGYYGHTAKELKQMLGDNGLDIQPNQPYRMLTYVGKTKHGNRPLFLVVYIEHSSGDFKKDLSKLPQEWVPLYVNVMSMPNRKPPVEAK